MIRSNDQKATKAVILDERNGVEKPLLDQLEGLGWTVLNLQMQSPASASHRTDFREVVIRPELEKALVAINPFLEPDQIEGLVNRIVDRKAPSLIENNKEVFELLTGFPSVDENRKTGEKSPTVRYLDFKNPKNNRFLAVCQFKVAIPGTDNHIIPDVVLFVNGMPLVLVECKSPLVNEPIGSAIDQMMRYSQQRGEVGEGNPALFWYNQFLVATCRNQAKFGTITTQIEKHFYRWSDPYPAKLSDLKTGGSSTPNDQQRLVAGMMRPENLLSLIQSYTVFSTNDKGQTIKVVGRYQQFRAVKKAIDRLRTGATTRERSGIIWHTQGSGKSLTMMFLVRELRQRTEFADWKVVFITDRTDLEEQLSGTAQSIGQKVKMADSIATLKTLLSGTAADLVMAMIHKFQERDMQAVFPELNASPHILTLTDEAHRSQYSLLGANFDKAIPNAARIAYTGTPIDKTEQTFGDYIDKYTMRESIADGTTLEIVYEGRTHSAAISDQAAADKQFADVFSEYNLKERLQILGYASRDAYLEAEDTIRMKAKDMVDHYVANVFPNGFKGQVVSTSREAAARYKRHLDAALAAKVAELEASNPSNVNVALLKTLETAVVISGGDHNEPPHLKALSNSADHKRHIKRFKMAFGTSADDGSGSLTGNVGLIIVNNMLLTGFDAPIEQVLYLDQVIRDHNLLQTIARVNRVADEKKEAGFVVDYVGIGNDLKRALDKYAEKEQQEILEELSNPEEEIGKLREAHKEIWALLKENGLEDFSDPDAFYDLFYDEDTRFKYVMAFKKLTQAFNIVLPRKEALDYLSDYQNFVKINELAYKHIGDTRLSMKGIPPKLRAITDAFLKSEGIEVKIEPISILDNDFQKEVDGHTRTRTKAAAVEHAIRHHLDIVEPEDPELAASFTEELLLIFQMFKDNWDRIYQELEKLRQKIMAKEKEETFGLHRRKQMPLFRIYKKEIFGDADLTEDQIAGLVNLTQLVSAKLTLELQMIGFWQSAPAQNRLKAELQDVFVLEKPDSLPTLIPIRNPLITRTMEWARENRGVLTGQAGDA